MGLSPPSAAGPFSGLAAGLGEGLREGRGGPPGARARAASRALVAGLPDSSGRRAGHCERRGCLAPGRRGGGGRTGPCTLGYLAYGIDALRSLSLLSWGA